MQKYEDEFTSGWTAINMSDAYVVLHDYFADLAEEQHGQECK